MGRLFLIKHAYLITRQPIWFYHPAFLVHFFCLSALEVICASIHSSKITSKDKRTIIERLLAASKTKAAAIFTFCASTRTWIAVY
jgi:hypothetical protein